jgi:uncharacterized protein (DUF1697 family)
MEATDYTHCVMAVVISMLRGVNLGGHKIIKMEALRTLYESLKFEDVATFIQSGNVVFRTKESDLKKISKRICDGIEKTFGHKVEVILRTTAEMRGVVERNPFATRTDVEPSKLLVWFLSSTPSTEARQKLLTLKVQGEELRLEGNELFIYFPEGQGKSKLSLPAVDRALGVLGTGRNLNSVRKLLEMAEKLEAGG